MSKIIGIDLGTTNSAVAIYDGKTGKILENQEGKRTTPSIVSFGKDGQIHVGDPAKNQAVSNAENTFYAIKRLIGRSFDDEEVQKMIKTAPFKIVPAKAGNEKSDAWVEIKKPDGTTETMAPAEISAKILLKLKEAAEEKLGEKITEAVITVPAYFDDSQKKATKDAGAIAGLNVRRIVNEPTAAALAFGLDDKKDQTIIVYDLGGGTFDVSVLELGGGLIEVKAANGDTFLGGEDFDRRIVDHILQEFKAETDVDILAMPEAQKQMCLQRIKQAAEDAKKTLSSSTETQISLPFITMKETGEPVNLDVMLTRSKLEDLVKDLIERSEGPCRKALADADLDMSDIDEVVMVGGMTRMPAVKEFVKKTFGKEPNCSVNPDEVVAAGASAQGAILTGELDEVILKDVIPLSLGIRINDGDVETIVPKQHSIPCTIKPEPFGISYDGQDTVRIRICQGERPKFDDNRELGEMVMEIKPGKKEDVKIFIQFDVDANGTLTVSAKDQNGAEIKQTLQANGGLTEDQVAEMMKDAEANKEADEKVRANRAAAAQASGMVSEVDSIKEKDYYKSASEEARKSFNTAAESLKAAVETKNNENIVELVKSFTDAKLKLGESAAAASSETANDDSAPEADAPKKDAAAGKPSAPGM